MVYFFHSDGVQCLFFTCMFAASYWSARRAAHFVSFFFLFPFRQRNSTCSAKAAGEVTGECHLMQAVRPVIWEPARTPTVIKTALNRNSLIDSVLTLAPTRRKKKPALPSPLFIWMLSQCSDCSLAARHRRKNCNEFCLAAPPQESFTAAHLHPRVLRRALFSSNSPLEAQQGLGATKKTYFAH